MQKTEVVFLKLEIVCNVKDQWMVRITLPQINKKYVYNDDTEKCTIMDTKTGRMEIKNYKWDTIRNLEEKTLKSENYDLAKAMMDYLKDKTYNKVEPNVFESTFEKTIVLTIY
ncbi:hypothetical protein J2127_000537 [Methanococcus voltae]|uniref:hypothetical protein n=1 Tax=Methanococcus voltae TaxID=2188 RepID=UPI001AEB2EE7|nr:hypothetical protein [Methanococcus voltae]MBP2143382.1 hypothetical protein [Methanococcus voltae]